MTNQYNAVPNESTLDAATGLYNSWFVLDTFGKKYPSTYKESDAKSIAKMLNEKLQEELMGGN